MLVVLFVKVVEDITPARKFGVIFNPTVASVQINTGEGEYRVKVNGR